MTDFPKSPGGVGGYAGSTEPDMALIAELLEQIQRRPPAIAESKLLLMHYFSCGWYEGAKDIVQDLKRHMPNDEEVLQAEATVDKKLHEVKHTAPDPRRVDSALKSATTTVSPMTPVQTVGQTTTHIDGNTKPAQKATQTIAQLDGNPNFSRKDLTDGYTSLRLKAKVFIKDILHLQKVQEKHSPPQSKVTLRVQAVLKGEKVDTSKSAGPPGSVQRLARTIEVNPDKATELVIADLEDTLHWIRASNGSASQADNDAIRDSLVERMQAVDSALSANLKIHAELALMHVEHENLDKSYVNDETMILCEPVKDIPRAEFYVTEDNYAWIMDELVQAIASNGGVMRNPLSRHMFTPRDVRGILMHPQGKSLTALQVQQHEMSNGVREETIAQMEKLSKALLEDQSRDLLASRHAIDEFLAYVATCRSILRLRYSFTDSQSTGTGAKSDRWSPMSCRGLSHRSGFRLFHWRGCA
jgi:hypothetical protein